MNLLLAALRNEPAIRLKTGLMKQLNVVKIKKGGFF